MNTTQQAYFKISTPSALRAEKVIILLLLNGMMKIEWWQEKP